MVFLNFKHYTFGSNSSGQLGHGTTEEKWLPQSGCEHFNILNPDRMNARKNARTTTIYTTFTTICLYLPKVEIQKNYKNSSIKSKVARNNKREKDGIITFFWRM